MIDPDDPFVRALDAIYAAPGIGKPAFMDSADAPITVVAIDHTCGAEVPAGRGGAGGIPVGGIELGTVRPCADIRIYETTRRERLGPRRFVQRAH